MARAAVIVLAGVLAAAVAQAQERPAAEAAGSGPQGRNRVVEIPPDASQADLSTDAEGNSNEAGAAEQGDSQQLIPGQDAEAWGAQFADLDQFANDDVYQSPIGALLQHDCTDLQPRQVACGLAVLEVRAGSPAAIAGIRPYAGLVHTLLGASVVSAAMVFPPAIAALGVVEQTHVGESYDLIIGVDGRRIRSIPDFQGALTGVRFGEVLYITIVRSGKRLQIPVRITR